MVNGKIVTLLVILQAVFVQNKVEVLSEDLLNHLPEDSSTKEFKLAYNLEFQNESAKPEHSHSKANGKVRFIDVTSNASMNEEEMETPTAKLSILNLLTGNEEEEEEEEDDHDHDSDYGNENLKEQDEEENEDIGIDFFGDDEEEIPDKLKDENDEGLLKQYHKHGLRMQNLVFPLLMAYKLKFFTIIPLLLGSLVLLVGTTGVAGFFFALFAAAMGIHVKTHEH